MATGEYDESFKVLLVGESGVGKSSLLLRYTEDTFEDMAPTIGVDFKNKKIDVDGKKIRLTLWDTAGQERFRTLTSAYYRGSHGVIFVYDVTQRDTFERLKEDWLGELKAYSTEEGIVRIVVGNKIDLAGRQVSSEEGARFARAEDALYIEASAKSNAGVVNTFDLIVEAMLSNPALCRGPRQENNVPVNSSSERGYSCCSSG